MNIHPRNEPAVWIGLLATLLLALQAEWADGQIDLTTFLPILLGIVTRHFVTPASESEPAEVDAE